MATLVTLTGLGIATAVVATNTSSGADDGDAATEGPPPATAEVARRDLEQIDDYDGTLAYAASQQLHIPGGGTVTGLPEVGTVVEHGDPLLWVDERPVILLIGSVPMWRDLGPEADDGADVFQLEQNLVDLGVDGADQLSVDEDWTSYTTEIVKNWQEALGVEETGRLERGDLVFRSGPVRIAERLVSIGDAAAGPVLRLSGTRQRVAVDVETAAVHAFEAGASVDVGLPDGTRVAGTVRRVDDTVTQVDDGSSSVPVIISVDEPQMVEGLDDLEVEVSMVVTAATDVLAVPVEALLALGEGGYAVELTNPVGTELVAVEIGAFADGWVEVTGDIQEGDSVVVPS